MRRNYLSFLLGSAVYTHTCDALLAQNARCHSNSLHQPPGSCYRDRISCTVLASSSNKEVPAEEPNDKPRRKGTVVRVSTSKRSIIKSPKDKSGTVNKRKTTKMTSPNMPLRQNRRIRNKDATKSSTDDKNKDDAPTKIPKNIASGAPFQRSQMLEHTLLTKEEELELGRKVVAARELREKVENLVEEIKFNQKLEMQENDEEEGEEEEEEVDMDFLSYELEYLSLYGFRPGQKEDYDLEDDLLIDHAMHRSKHLSQLKSGAQSDLFPKQTKKRSGYRNSSSSSAASSNSYTNLLHIPIHSLSDQDVISLGVPGGKAQAVDILLEGAHAREVLMRRNLKLVISIAKNWMRNSYKAENEGSATIAKVGGKTRFLGQMYDGSWDKPSLDEAVQEGVLGLARAVDKYDPERGLRFSTYATHWVTSYVRICFQRAVTGCLRVPSQLHDIKAAYNRIVRDHYEISNSPPAMGSIAKKLGITEQRLSTAIRATGSLLSVDSPMVLSGNGNYKGSAAGGDGGSSGDLLILDTLHCAEPKPEDQVETSFLRQCLENAMATELTPYERDILRLRLGLDSGEAKTVRQIVELCGGSITTADVRNAERRAFKKLRSPTSVHTHNLLAYLDMSGDFLLNR